MGADCWHGYEWIECPWCGHEHDDEEIEEAYAEEEDDEDQ
jgi:hypothetical protein